MRHGRGTRLRGALPVRRSTIVLDDLARPFMRAWYLTRESALATVPYPEDAPVARVPGPDPARVLLLGNGAATGWGVRSHDLALTGRLARALADSTGRGVQVDARVDGGVRLAGIPRLLDEVALRRYAAVVVVAGMSDAVNLTPLRTCRDATVELLDRIRRRAPGAGVLVVGPQPVGSARVYTGWPSVIAERHRVAMIQVLRAVCAEHGTAFAVLDAPSAEAARTGYRSPAVYAEWAASIATRLTPLLAPGSGASGRQPEVERQRATVAMLPDAPPDAGLDRITLLARKLFGVELAAVTLLDGDELKLRSVSGSDPGRLPRASSACNQTIRGDGALVISDLAADPRFSGSPAVAGDAAMRFYAGYPIESPEGYRVGALCILDRERRSPHEVDTEALSDLALLAQKELWAAVERAGAR